MIHRRVLILAAVAFLTAAGGVGTLAINAFRPADWYFMPGELGRVTRLRFGGSDDRRIGGSAIGNRTSDQPSLGSSGFRTRAFSSLNRPDEIKWGQRNGLSGAPGFGHHLNAVFPPELYVTHPEYFPLNGGKRLRPPPNAQFWQPDLGRKDVAAFAAEQAKRYFDQHPSAESFSLGVDDGLNFGESPETVALLRDRFRGGSEDRKVRGSEGLRVGGTRSASGGSEGRRGGGPDGRTSEGSDDQRGAVDQSDTRNSEGDHRASEPQTFRPSGIHYFRGRPDFSALVFTFMNRAAADLARSYPDKYLGCLAYYWCENVPPFTVDPHVVPFLTADRSQSYDPAFKREEFALQEGWARALSVRSTRDRGSEDRRVGWSANNSDTLTIRPSDAQRTNQTRIQPRLGLYDYLDGYGFLIPRVPIHAFAEHIRHAYEVGFTDYFGESSWNWGVEGPMPWVIAQLLQDPEQDVDRLLDTYYAAYFQSAAGPMRQFFERCEEKWMTQPGPSYWLKFYRNSSQAALFPSRDCRELRTQLTEAAAQANSDIVRQRVAFVSDAFGLTERFVAFCEARNELTARVLRHQLEGLEGERLLAEYREMRREFFRYGHDLEQRSPLAYYPINYQDWVRDDPSFAARQELAATRGSEDRKVGGSVTRGARPEGQKVGVSEDRWTGQADTQNLRTSDPQSALAGGREVLPNGELAGPLTAGRRIAGLQYGIDLPAPWQSKVEPTQRGVAVLVGGSEDPRGGGPVAREVRPEDQGGGKAAAREARPQNPEGRRVGESEDRMPGRTEPRSLRPSDLQRTRSRVLRLSAQESTIVFTWAPATPGKTYAASVWTRAQVSPSDIVELVIGWLDAKQKRIGNPIGIRLPEGSWPDWVQLVQGAKAPEGTAWVGIQLLVQHQVGEDWAEARDFSLREQ